MTRTAQHIVLALIMDGYDAAQIRDAMQDGAYLASRPEISQEIAEEIHDWARKAAQA